MAETRNLLTIHGEPVSQYRGYERSQGTALPASAAPILADEPPWHCTITISIGIMRTPGIKPAGVQAQERGLMRRRLGWRRGGGAATDGDSASPGGRVLSGRWATAGTLGCMGSRSRSEMPAGDAGLAVSIARLISSTAIWEFV